MRPSHQSNLPVALTSFIGRHLEMAELQRLVSSTRLLTLNGAGGVGKTRLALQVASAILDECADGVRLVELAALADPRLVVQALARVLDVPEQTGRPLLDVLADTLRSRRLLLVLDNCEHLVQACAELAEALLQTCPSLRIMATSREPLGVPGETVWSVPPLAVPEAVERLPIEQLSSCESVRLFVERAGAVLPGFALTDGNAPAVAEICRRLDGIPLAIELAAARVKVLAPADIDARLDDRLRLLVAGSRTAPPRQQTLRATLDWSYDLLSAPERQLFARLSVFAGGCTLEAAEAVCAETTGPESAQPEGDASPRPRTAFSTPDILELLAQLVDKSLVQVEHSPARPTRYRLLETLRQYGREQLESDGEADAARRRHAAFFLELAEPGGFRFGAPDQAGRLGPLESEHDNLRTALRWLIHAGEVDSARRLGVSLKSLWHLGGHLGEGRVWLAELLALPAASADKATRAQLLYGAGFLAWLQGDADAARGPLEECISLWRELENPFEIAHSLVSLGMAARLQGDRRAARAYFEEAAGRVQEVGDLALQSTALYGLGLLAYDEGDDAAARAMADQALAVATRGGWVRMIVGSLGLLGEVSYREQNYAAARALLEQGRAAARAGGDKWAEAGILVPLTRAATEQGNVVEAAALLGESLERWRDLGNRQGIADALEAGAQLAAALARPDCAARLAGAAAALREGGSATPAVGAIEALWTARAQTALGNQAFAAAWAAGRAMSLDEATEQALALKNSASAAAGGRSAERQVDALTPREREVAALIARGFTNRQMARALVITEKTAANHVARVLDKLGVHSKTQLAARASEWGLHTPT